jgi:hypothetical protein
MLAVASGMASTPVLAGDFGSWAALIVSGDARAHSGAASEVFDNGRRDLASALRSIGFAEDRIMQFSAQPAYDHDPNLKLSNIDAIRSEFTRAAKPAAGGCFLYFTSHGRGDGVIVYDAVLTPRALARIVGDACGDKPTIAIVSACFSGIFIPPVRSNTRMVMSAARRDRTSFGCGEADKYTFFDQCVIESIPAAANFPALAGKVRECVASREKAEGVDEPSEPQVSIGRTIGTTLNQPAYSFR